MTRAERIAQAHGLRFAGGWTQQRIADELGVALATVQRWLDPTAARAWSRRADAKRMPAKHAWRHKHTRATCACGAPMAVGSKYDGTIQCQACHLAEVETEVWCDAGSKGAAIVQGRVELDKAIYEAWHRGLADGSSPREIAFSLGITQAALMEHVGLMRRAGHDLPSRHRVAA
jgi:hypothetical protein